MIEDKKIDASFFPILIMVALMIFKVLIKRKNSLV